MKDKVLSKIGKQFRDDFEAAYADIGCSCRISSPCSYCMHPGNPANLEELPEAWEDDVSDVAVEEMVDGQLVFIMTPVKSSNIGSVGYHQDTSTMAIKFNNGGTYHFKGVTPEKYQDFISAESVGRFFLAEIKGKFEAEKV